MSNTTTSIRIFTHDDVPNMDALEVQANDLAVSDGLGIEFIAVDVDASEAMKAGVIGLPATPDEHPTSFWIAKPRPVAALDVTAVMEVSSSFLLLYRSRT